MGGLDANELRKRGEKLDRSKTRAMGASGPPARLIAANGMAHVGPKPWPELQPLEPTTTAQAFPTDALPPSIRIFVEHLARSLYIPADIPGALTLAVISSATAGRLRVMVRPGYFEPALVYVAAIAPPSSLKSPAFKAVTEPIHRFQADRVKAEAGAIESARALAEVCQKALRKAKERATSASGDVERLEAEKAVDDLARKAADAQVPEAFRLITGSPTPAALASLLAAHNGRMAVLSDEAHGLTRLLLGSKQEGGLDLGPLLNGYDGAPYCADRKQADSSNIEAAYLTLGLTAQNHVLQLLAGSRGVSELGLIARLSFAVPEPLPGARPFDLPVIPDDVRERYRATIKNLLEWGHGTRGDDVVALDADAYRELGAFHARLEAGRQPGQRYAEIPAINEWMGKHAGRVARISGLFHAAERMEAGAYPGEGKISGDTMRRAVKLGDYQIAHLGRAFDAMGTDDVASDALAVVEWVRAHRVSSLRPRDLSRTHTRFKKRRDSLARAIKLLCANAYLRPAGGARGELYEVNPAALAHSKLSATVCEVSPGSVTA